MFYVCTMHFLEIEHNKFTKAIEKGLRNTWHCSNKWPKQHKNQGFHAIIYTSDLAHFKRLRNTARDLTVRALEGWWANDQSNQCPYFAFYFLIRSYKNEQYLTVLLYFWRNWGFGGLEINFWRSETCVSSVGNAQWQLENWAWQLQAASFCLLLALSFLPFVF